MASVGPGFVPLRNLALRVNLDDQLQVEDQSGVKVAGRLTRLTRDEIAIQTEAGEKRFTRMYPQAGVGLVIPLSSRLALAPEVRFDYLVLGGILRPNLAVVYRLH